jgi:hypothetical protein
MWIGAAYLQPMVTSPHDIHVKEHPLMAYWKRILILLATVFALVPLEADAIQTGMDSAALCDVQSFNRASLQVEGQLLRSAPIDTCTGKTCTLDAYNRSLLQAEGQVLLNVVDEASARTMCAMQSYEQAEVQAEGQPWTAPEDEAVATTP